MTSYTVTLFLHLLAVMAGFGATAVIHLGLMRMRKAERASDARDALMLAGSTAKAMPLVGLALLLTGGYMTQTRWSWNTPWIDVSITGLVLMMIIGGGVLGRRMRALGPQLGRAGDSAMDDALISAVRDPSLWIIAQLPPLLAIGVMFVMTTKPTMGLGFVELLVVAALGVLVATPSSRRVRAESGVAVEE
ncbi:MAG TPA: DUF2269 family protein [Gemmatimonadaceae bacterium]